MAQHVPSAVIAAAAAAVTGLVAMMVLVILCVSRSRRQRKKEREFVDKVKARTAKEQQLVVATDGSGAPSSTQPKSSSTDSFSSNKEIQLHSLQIRQKGVQYPDDYAQPPFASSSSSVSFSSSSSSSSSFLPSSHSSGRKLEPADSIMLAKAMRPKSANAVLPNMVVDDVDDVDDVVADAAPASLVTACAACGWCWCWWDLLAKGTSGSLRRPALLLRRFPVGECVALPPPLLLPPLLAVGLVGVTGVDADMRVAPECTRSRGGDDVAASRNVDTAAPSPRLLLLLRLLLSCMWEA